MPVRFPYDELTYDGIFSLALYTAVFEISPKIAVPSRRCWRFLTPRTPRYPPATGPRTPRAVAIYPRAVFIVAIELTQPGEHRPAFGVHLEVHLIDERLPWPAVAHDQVFQFFQPSQMHPQLCVAPARVLPHRGPRETVVQPLDLEPRAFFSHHLVDQQQQAPRLRLHFVKRWRQHFGDELQGQLHVV